MLCASVWLMLSSMLYSLRLSSGSSFPKPLTLEEERYYLEKSAAAWIARLERGELLARQTLIERNLRLVAHIMNKG